MATLEDFDEEAKAPVATRPGGKVDLSSVPNGDYKLRVTSMAERSIAGGFLILEMNYEIVTDGPLYGTKLDKTFWVVNKDQDTGQPKKDADALGRFRKDIAVLGFDVEKWNSDHQRKFGAEFKKACGIIPGVECHAKKTSKAGEKGKVYHNVYINTRAEDDGKSPTFGPEELAAGIDPFGGGNDVPN